MEEAFELPGAALVSKLAAWSTVRVIAAMCASGVAAPALSQVAPRQQRCNALVEVARDLFLVTAAGTPVARFTSDASVKHSPALAPDGDRVAFIPDAAPDTVRVVEVGGAAASFPARRPERPDHAAPAATLIGVYWSSSDLLRLESHLGKNAARFEFYRVPAALSSEARVAAPPSVGETCAVEPDGVRVACVQEGEVLIDGEVVFSASPMAGATMLDSAKVTAGAPIRTKGGPGFRIELVSLSNGLVTLRVVLPTGNWEQSTVRSGAFVPVTLNDALFGVVPVVTDAKRGVVSVDLFKSRLGPRPFSSIAWVPGGPQPTLVLVEDAESGPALLVLRHADDRKGCSRRQAERGFAWTVLGRASLDVAEPVDDFRFNSRATFMFHTYRAFGEGSFRLGEVTSQCTAIVKIGATAEFPVELRVDVGNGPVSRPVLGWSCR